jgi:hypothetical protein
VKIELIVIADEAEAVIEGLNAASGSAGGEAYAFRRWDRERRCRASGTRKRSTMAHMMAAGETVASAVRAARESVSVALRAVI